MSFFGGFLIFAFQMLALGSELKVLMQCGGHLNLVNLLGIVAENIANRKLYPDNRAVLSI